MRLRKKWCRPRHRGQQKGHKFIQKAVNFQPEQISRTLSASDILRCDCGGLLKSQSHIGLKVFVIGELADCLECLRCNYLEASLMRLLHQRQMVALGIRQERLGKAVNCYFDSLIARHIKQANSSKGRVNSGETRHHPAHCQLNIVYTARQGSKAVECRFGRMNACSINQAESWLQPNNATA